MNWPPSETHITTWWCFHRNELVISFLDAQLAAKYQRANPEGRIYSNLSQDDQASKEVYLPRPEGLLSLRSSSQGQSYSLVLDFATEDNARVWHEKALITSIIPDRSKKRVYISREVRSQKLMAPRQVSNDAHLTAPGTI
jgi:hypothetical protein